MKHKRGRVRSLELEIQFNDETHINYQVLLKEVVPPLPISLSPTLAVIFSIGAHFTP